MRYLGVGWRVAQVSGAGWGSAQQGPHGLCTGRDMRGLLVLPSTGQHRMAPQVFLAVAPSQPLVLFVPKKAVLQISATTLTFGRHEVF